MRKGHIRISIRCRSIAVGVLALGLSAAFASTAAACTGSDLIPTGANFPTVQRATICLINDLRAQNGRAALSSNAQLYRSARRHAESMVAERFFSHAGADGSDVESRIRATGYMTRVTSWMIGENLGMGTGDLGTPASTVQAWLESSQHRSEMLYSRYRDVGLAIAIGTPFGTPDGATYVANFGRHTKAKRSTHRRRR